MRVLKEFSDGQKLVFDTGKVDDYRVTYMDGSGRPMLSPTDEFFFKFALSLGRNKSVWGIIQFIADQIDSRTEFSQIDIPTLHGTEWELKMFSAYAAAVIAEERKRWSKLGKRVKLLGYYQVLILGYTPIEAANWSRGRGWREISLECSKYGF